MDPTVKGKDLHVILTYKKEVENYEVKQDIIRFLGKLQRKAKGKIELSYTINPILDKRPAIHVLLRMSEQLNETELISLWDKGMAKVAIIEESDKRAMEFYLNKGFA